MKKLPFDLEKALAGESVVTRDGQGVEHIVWLNKLQSDFNVLAVIEGRLYQFLVSGSARSEGQEHYLDLFMKQNTITVNGFEVPAPMNEPADFGAYYYYPAFDKDCLVFVETWADTGTDKRTLSMGVAHTTKGAAIAHAKAMLGINPEEDVW